MTAIARLTRAELRKLATTRTFLITLALSAGFGLISVALGYITRSTVAAVVGAVGWVLFAELAILGTLAPHLAKWLITGSATALTNPPVTGSGALTPAAAVAVPNAYALRLHALPAPLALRSGAG